ncbi:response regulator transcription factor [Psychrobacillus sp.]|uniref:response regulator transcription factor n=1 Tax=Psychrobacillus sp. TaxID=1871623 RepID=UPI0028BEAA24|nr:response regulator transcription factor [Psychrobacillus sp.]
MSECIKIMIAEDFHLLLEDLSELINAQTDMQVVATATTGREMVELAKSVDHDIILMDIEMENTTAGIVATELIRDWDKDKKIIYLTAHETDEFILTAMGTGAVDYMVKGIAEEEILNHIRSAHKGHPLLEGKIQQIVLQEYTRLQQSERGLLFFIQNISNLTMTERELIGYLVQGMKIREIALERSVEVVTIKSQVSTLLKKFGASRTKEVVKKINDLKLTHLF